MIAAYRNDTARPCHETEEIQALADRIAAKHAARSEAEAAAITRAAIQRWRHRDLAAKRLRRADSVPAPHVTAAHDTGRHDLIQFPRSE